MLKFQGERFADLFYEALWRDHPRSRSLFRQTDVPGQKQSLMAGLEAIVAGLSQPERLALELAEMGVRHRAYGVLPKHYAWVADAWRQSLGICLGERWDATAKRDWELVIRRVTSAMRAGASSLDTRGARP